MGTGTAPVRGSLLAPAWARAVARRLGFAGMSALTLAPAGRASAASNVRGAPGSIRVGHLVAPAEADAASRERWAPWDVRPRLPDAAFVRRRSKCVAGCSRGGAICKELRFD